ncbi:MAG: hypothetical protein COB36_10965 [Alphaproteobacteria bacterium]|nr:MAG: hypothetical protein COB36_10965 [Alphaproteobacteria bacterium]
MAKIVCKKARNSARGEDCTFNILEVCNFNSETTVLCHLPDGAKGMGMKSCDLTSAAYGCSSCHDVVDGRVYDDKYQEHSEWYMRRAQTRTLRRMIVIGVVKFG